MATVRVCPLSEALAHWPEAGGLEGLDLPAAGRAGHALIIAGDLRMRDLDVDTILDRDDLGRLDAHARREAQAATLVIVQGDLQVEQALIAQPGRIARHLLVLGNAQLRCMLLDGWTLTVRGDLAVDDLLWCDSALSGVAVQGRLRARVALFTRGSRGVAPGAAEQSIRYLLSETPDRPCIAGLCGIAPALGSAALGVIFPPGLHARAAPLDTGLAGRLDREKVCAALRQGQPAVRSSSEIDALYPGSRDLFPDDAISLANILAVVRSSVVALREHTASGWFAQTDFVICRRHLDADGDQRDDSVYVTVWKQWDFYLSVQPAGASRSLPARIADVLRRRSPPGGPELTLLHRRYADGVAGDWQLLIADAAPDAWAACTAAWRGVLDYVRKAVGQHRARYPLHRALIATVSPSAIERLSMLPVFMDHYNDWWSTDRNGFWEGDLWIAARQPCMHGGEPWGRALKLSWANGAPGAGDDADDAHASYQVDVDEARQGPALASFSYAQRQSAPRVPLPPGAADHIAQLLWFFATAQQRLGVAPESCLDDAAEAPDTGIVGGPGR